MINNNVSSKNAEFWNELCGSQHAQYLGITDTSPESLKKFDEWYFDYYPYLYDHIPFKEFKDKDVLEIGLGYGSVSQKLAEFGANYVGLDIAEGPVAMVNHRLKQAKLKGFAIQGSILDPPFRKQSFDAIVAIGCLHHTGNLKLAIDRCYELLKNFGKLIFSVYYAYSYRRWRMVPGKTLNYLLRELVGYRGVIEGNTFRERIAYDRDSKGEAAPYTDWISIKSLKKLCAKFSKFRAKLENINQEPPFSKIERRKLLSTFLPKIVGLDIYATAIK